MITGARFRYALEPVMLTRLWDRDLLLAELGEHNRSVSRQQELIAALHAQSAALGREWGALAGSSEAMSVERFVRMTRYLSELARQIREQDAELARLAELREQLIGRVVLSQRALEAVEQHRDDMRDKLMQSRLSGDFNIADDQWNTLQAGA